MIKHKSLAPTQPPRVRFAPSPTGPIHIGGVRTVLFNLLFARKYGGVFILRIEDTDTERSDAKWEKYLIENLHWLNLEWDEGVEIEGKYGPYRQSERTAVYKKYIADLLKKGLAYYCFCSETDLEAERQEMLARGIAPRYSGRCRDLTKEETAKRLTEGASSVIRFKIPPKTLGFDDLIHGHISFDGAMFGDIVIAKTPELPLYNLAAAIDDYEMKISHVIRGEEHISNTPKQLALQEALGLPSPYYAHIPLILGPDKSKLSKRHGSFAVHEYREMGYLPKAIINFIALLGWHPTGDQEIFTFEELIQEFSLERVQKTGAIFNSEKLNWVNARYVKEKSSAELLELTKPYWEKAGFKPQEFPEEFLLRIVTLSKERLNKISDIVHQTEFFFKTPLYPTELLLWKTMSLEDLRAALSTLRHELEKVSDKEFTVSGLQQALEPTVAQDKGSYLWPLRVALSGREASPGPYEIAAILGKTETLKRIAYATGLCEN